MPRHCDLNASSFHKHTLTHVTDALGTMVVHHHQQASPVYPDFQSVLAYKAWISYMTLAHHTLLIPQLIANLHQVHTTDLLVFYDSIADSR